VRSGKNLVLKGKIGGVRSVGGVFDPERKKPSDGKIGERSKERSSSPRILKGGPLLVAGERRSDGRDKSFVRNLCKGKEGRQKRGLMAKVLREQERKHGRLP